MSTWTITMWRCDICDLEAPKDAEGWADTIYAHGCPVHAEHVLSHKAIVDSETRGRGRQQKAIWRLRCSCGWKPEPSWDAYTSRSLVNAQRVHLRETR